MKSKILTIGLLIGLIVFTSCSNDTQPVEETQTPHTQEEDQPKEPSEGEKKYEDIKSSCELLGSWTINNGITNSSYDYEIYSNADELIGVMKFEKMKFENLKRNGNKYEVQDNSYGEYYVIDGNNNMKLFDQDGDLTNAGYTAKKKSNGRHY